MITGACHCGTIKWDLKTHPDSALACNCSICHRYGALWVYGILGKDVRVSGNPKAYVRGAEQTIQFMFCRQCGCMTHYVALRPNEDGDLRCAVNLRMADFELVADINAKRFDGRDTWTKLPSDGLTIRDLWA